MKWFERRITDRDDREAKQIEQKFGLEGYAMWEKIQQIIAENMDASNFEEWGFVAEGETIESLAKKIRCTPEKLKEFVKFCDEQLIFEKKNKRLFCQYVLDRMNEYARKIQKKEKSEKGGKAVISKNPRNNTLHNNHNTVHNNTVTNTVSTKRNGFLKKLPVLITDKDHIEYVAQEVARKLNDKKSIAFIRQIVTRVPESWLWPNVAEIVSDKAKNPGGALTKRVKVYAGV